MVLYKACPKYMELLHDNENVIEKLKNRLPGYPMKKLEKVKRIIDLISVNDKEIISEITKELGVTERTVSRYLSDMKTANTIERVGSDSGGFWKISEI